MSTTSSLTPLNGGEFVGSAFDLKASNGSTGNAREQYTTEAVAKGHTVAAVQWLNSKSCTCCAVLVYIERVLVCESFLTSNSSSLSVSNILRLVAH